MTDMRGIEIRVGDTVVYPGCRSSSLWLNQGMVESIQEPLFQEGCFGRRQIRTGSLKVRRVPRNASEKVRSVNVGSTSWVAVVR